MKKMYGLVLILVLVSTVFLSSCSSQNGSYTSKSYRNKSKKTKIYHSKKKGDFKFQLYRARETEPISN